MPTIRRKPHHSRTSGMLISLVLLCILAGAVLIFRQRIYDFARLYHYTPPSEIALLAADDTMTNYTKHVFYVNHPRLLSTVASFRAQCPEDETDIVIGCYHVGQAGIYIYNVKDQSLAGVQQVTAAHEVLHALYARLSGEARAQLDSELETYYLHGLDNSTVAAEIKLYQQTEPGSVYDEMSCTFGTEIADLPPALNAYYRQFFSDRQAIVGYEQHYQAAFTSRQDEITADDAQLTDWKQQITNQEQTLAKQRQQITNERSQLQSLVSTNPAAYNSQIQSFNGAVTSYNNALDLLQTLINSYNQLVATRNTTAGALDTLVSAIDTRQVPKTE